VKAIDWADKHPAIATCSLALLVFLGLHGLAAIHDGPLLLARPDPGRRLTIYGQLAASAVAVLGISLTVLAILIALPDRPVITDIRQGETWPRLRNLLLVTAFLSLLALVAAHLGAALDGGPRGCEWLEQSLLACSAATVLALLAAGVTFWLVLRSADQPDDPSRGRGRGG
jgi:hypothetical protein